MFRVLSLVVGLCLVAGCGDGRPQTAPVSGKVIYNGEPLKTGTVMFLSNTPNMPYATGEIGPDGVYKMKTFEDGDGAVLGSHRVSISAVEVPNPAVPEARSLLPSKYSTDATSGLTAEVKEGENVIDFTLEAEKTRRK
ncbi:MAG TPA: hypothetical protein VM452_11500 [Caulifigura sp.]|jgi:hypothetical protein|nr:hypothetical protein [Caulifigura sp.]